MILTLVAAFVASSRAQPVTFHEVAAPLSRVMPALSEACHLQLKVAPALQRDVVCIDVHGATASDLLKKLAWSTGGRWEQGADGSYVLAISDVLRSVQAQDELKRETALVVRQFASSDLKEPIQGMSDDVEHGPDPTPLLRMFDPAVLAAIPRGKRVVFSTSPNRLQAPFPFDVRSVLPVVIAKYNERLKSHAVDANVAGSAEASPYEARPITEPVAKATLAVTKAYDANSEQVVGRLALYDAAGKRLCPDNGGEFDGFVPPGEDDRSPSIELPREARLFSKYCSERLQHTMHWAVPTDSQPKPLSAAGYEEAQERFLHPERVDPLTYASGLLQALATADGDQLVACLPDAFATVATQAVESDYTVDSLRQFLRESTFVDVESGGGWLSARPRDPAEAESERADRQELGKVLHMLAIRPWLGRPDVEALARFGYGRDGESLCDRWCEIARPAYFDGENAVAQDWDALRFIQSTTAADRLLSQGGSIELACQPDHVAELQRIVFGSDSSTLEGRLVCFDPRRSVVGAEPTELLPFGIPATVRLICTVTPGAVYQAKGDTAPRGAPILGSDPIDANDIACHEADVEFNQTRPDGATAGPSADRTPTAMLVGKRTSIGVHIDLGYGLSLSGWIAFDDMTGAETVAYGDLKASMHAEVADKLRMLRESGIFGPGQSGAGSPP